MGVDYHVCDICGQIVTQDCFCCEGDNCPTGIICCICDDGYFVHDQNDDEYCVLCYEKTHKWRKNITNESKQNLINALLETQRGKRDNAKAELKRLKKLRGKLKKRERKTGDDDVKKMKKLVSQWEKSEKIFESRSEIQRLLAKNNKWFFDVIYTFDQLIDDDNQEFRNIVVDRVDNKKDFLKQVESYLTKKQKKHLVKISTCMDTYDDSYPKFLEKCNGQFLYIKGKEQKLKSKAKIIKDE